MSRLQTRFAQLKQQNRAGPDDNDGAGRHDGVRGAHPMIP